MKISYIGIPPRVIEPMNLLTNAGHKTFIVGECVRDAILGKTPHTWRVCTDAKRKEIDAITSSFSQQNAMTGVDNDRIELVSAANICDYLEFASFAINAIAYNHDDGFVDPFGGIRDLQSGIIRCAGNPTDCFSENNELIFEAIRLSAALRSVIDKNTYRAMQQCAKKSLDNNSALLHRIFMENETDAESVIQQNRDVIRTIFPDFFTKRRCFIARVK